MKKTIIALCIAGLFAVVTAINLDFVSENGHDFNLNGLIKTAIASSENKSEPPKTYPADNPYYCINGKVVNICVYKASPGCNVSSQDTCD